MRARDEVLGEGFADLLRRCACRPVGEVLVGLCDCNVGRSNGKGGKKNRVDKISQHPIGSSFRSADHLASCYSACKTKSTAVPQSRGCLSGPEGGVFLAAGAGFLSGLDTPKLIRKKRSPLRSESMMLMRIDPLLLRLFRGHPRRCGVRTLG